MIEMDLCTRDNKINIIFKRERHSSQTNYLVLGEKCLSTF